MGWSFNLKTILFLGILLFSSGCLKDNMNPSDSFSTTNTISILTYLEANGDYN